MEFEDEKGANLRDTSSHNSDERYHWLVKVRDAEGRQVGKSDDFWAVNVILTCLPF